MMRKYMKVAGTLAVLLGAFGIIISGNFSPFQWYNNYKQNAAVAANLKTIRAVAPDYGKLSVTIDADSGTVKVSMGNITIAAKPDTKEVAVSDNSTQPLSFRPPSGVKENSFLSEATMALDARKKGTLYAGGIGANLLAELQLMNFEKQKGQQQ